jgi:hypothetical protein
MNPEMKFDLPRKGLSENFIGSRLKSGSRDKFYFTHTRTHLLARVLKYQIYKEIQGRNNFLRICHDTFFSFVRPCSDTDLSSSEVSTNFIVSPRFLGIVKEILFFP